MRPRFFVPDADAGECALPDDEAHHAMHVLRLRAGADVGVFDGRGREWTARVASAQKRTGVTVVLEREIEAVAEPPVHVTLGIGLLKGDQMDAVVRDATMLGVAAIAPIASEHAVVAARIRGDAAIARWQRVAVSSAKQCRRAVVPVVEHVQPLVQVLTRENVGALLMCVEPGAQIAGTPFVDRPSRALALVGPEGGWSAGEIEMLTSRGAHQVQLGPRTLRAETAPTVLLSALWTTWGWVSGR